MHKLGLATMRLLPYSIFLQVMAFGGSPKDKIASMIHLIEKLKNEATPIPSKEPVEEKDVRNQDQEPEEPSSMPYSSAKSRSRRTRGSRAKNEIKGG